MTVLQLEDFEGGGPLGAAVVEADTIFSNVDNVGITYVAGLAGSFACNIAPATTGAVRNSGFTAMGRVVARVRFKFANAPAGDVVIGHVCSGDPNAGGTRIAHLYLTTDRRLRITDVFGSPITSAMQLTAGTEYAFEWSVNPGNNTQALRIFTDTSATAAAAETLNNTATAAVDTADWVQVGKMTNVVWTGGITIDNYRRADDWWANGAAVADEFSEEFDGFGAVDNDITTNANITAITGAAPKVAAGGPHTDQKVARFGQQSSADRWIRSAQYPLDSPTFERFYCKIESQPVNEDQRLQFWRAGGASADVLSMTFALGSGATVDLELWDATFGTVGAEPIGRIAGLPVDIDMRIDVATDVSVGPGLVTVDVWAGSKQHSTSNPTGQMVADITGTTSLRYRYLGQRTAAATSVHRALCVDGWVGNAQAAPGPLAAADQYDPPLNTQWQFYEIVAGVPVKLDASVALNDDDSNINIGNTSVVGDPDNPNPGTERFSGDPGVGKVLIGWCSLGSNWAYHYHLTPQLRNVTPGTDSAGKSYAANPNIAGGHYRAFTSPPWSSAAIGEDWFGLASWGTWEEGRQAMANCDILNISFCMDHASSDNTLYLQRIVDGYYDTWLDQLADRIGDCHERYGSACHFNWANEPDQLDKNWYTSNSAFRLARRASRYAHFYLLGKGLPRSAFEVTNMMHFNQTARMHQTLWNNHKSRGYPTSGVSNANIMAMYQWDNDWKGTITPAGGAFWQTGWDPNPADFYSGSEMDSHGYGRGQITRIWVCNSYCADGWGGGHDNLSDAAFATHVQSLWGNGGATFQWLRGRYGAKGTAGASNMPVTVNEWGYYIRDDANNTYMAETLDAGKRYMKDAVDHNVVAITKWRNEEGWGSQGAQPGPIGFGYKNSYAGGAGWEADPTDANRKMYASMFSHAAAALPNREGTDIGPGKTYTKKPISPQHN